MFIKVIYKDSEEMIVNPNCYIRLIYEYIKIKAGVPDGVEIDLCDQKGDFQKIYQPPYYKSGLEILERRKTYFLVALKLDNYGEVVPVPFLHPCHSHYEYLVKKLETNKSLIELEDAFINCDVTVRKDKIYSSKNTSDDNSNVIITNMGRQTNKRRYSSKRSGVFPNFIDKALQTDVTMFPPVKEIKRDSTRKTTHRLNNKKKSNENKTILSGRINSWYLSTSNESLKNIEK